MPRNLIVRFAVDQGVRLVGLGVMLFWSAGTLGWWPGWAFVAVSAAWVVATAVVIVRNNPNLLAERISPPKGAKRWDVILMSAHGILQMAVYVVGGLDRRFGWTAGLPLAAQLAALAACILGYAVTVWATACNPFFSLIVRIQTDRGHTVATAGPYRLVRHPAYAGAILLGASLGVLLGSWWAFLIGIVDSLLFVLRTFLEDRDLKRELPGYSDYARQVRYRLLPGIW
ncbi:MAG: isoprenylcysteine carboxylmethyltransferase family protein [Chloroflexi bacterium]|nr:isoprenylcysteine carboxylmethyltransferase family protein [Chloroflexota bacterium]